MITNRDDSAHMRVWTISNLLSISRLVLAAPIAYLLLLHGEGVRYLVLGLIAIAVATDLLDGALARKLNQVTELGKILDPLADKIAIAVVVSVLVMKESFPLWLFIVVTGRDVLILIAGAYVRRTRQIVLQSNRAGKWAATSIAMLIFVTVLELPELRWVSGVLITASLILVGVSTWQYGERFVATLRNEH